MSSTFWINEPKILIDVKQPIIPNTNLSCETNINAITKIVIVISLLGMIITESLNYVISGVLTILLLIFIYYHTKKREYYSNLSKEEILNRCKLKTVTTKPTKTNPLMNVTLPEINENPNRAPASDSYLPTTIKEINDDVKKDIIEKNDLDPRLFKDLGDQMTFDQSMRQFYTTASTTIPNDQDAFAEFCYGDMKSCKEDNSVCTGNIPTFNQLT